MWCDAMAIAWRPDEQKRLTVVAETVCGSPERSQGGLDPGVEIDREREAGNRGETDASARIVRRENDLHVLDADVGHEHEEILDRTVADREAADRARVAVDEDVAPEI